MGTLLFIDFLRIIPFEQKLTFAFFTILYVFHNSIYRFKLLILINWLTNQRIYIYLYLKIPASFDLHF